MDDEGSYQGSNKRDTSKQIQKHHEHLEALKAASSFMEGPTPYANVDFALDKAIKIGQNILYRVDFDFHLSWLSYPIDKVPNPKAVDLLRSQPELYVHLQVELNKYLTGNFVLGLCGKIIIMTSMAVSIGQGERMGNWPMYTRASRLFHSRP